MCGNESQTYCSTFRGGLFDKSLSSTWSSAAGLTALGLDNTTTGAANNDVFGTDTIKIGPQVNSSKYPLGLLRPGTDDSNSIGMASNSTLMNFLLAAKALGSSTWGYNHGWTGSETGYQADGSLVLGGYDQAKIAGNNVTLPMAPNDQLLISVSDMVLNFKNGTNTSLLGPSRGSSFKALVHPRIESITLSNDIWQNFLNFTGSKETAPYETGRSTGPTSYWSMKVLAGTQ